MNARIGVGVLAAAVVVSCAGAAGATDPSSDSLSPPRGKAVADAPASAARAAATRSPSATPGDKSGSAATSSPRSTKISPPRTRLTPRDDTVRPLPKTPPGALDQQKASAILKAVVGKPTIKLRGAKDVQVVFGPLTAGRFLADLKAEQGELDEYGWTERGTTSVVSLKITKRKGKTATVSACLDQSKVSIQDADGKSIGSSDVPRAMHLYDYGQQADGSWRITAHRFPTDPTC